MAPSGATQSTRYFLTAKKHKASLKRSHPKQNEDPDYIPNIPTSHEVRPRKRTRRNGFITFKLKQHYPPPSHDSETAPSSPDTVIQTPETQKPQPQPLIVQKRILGDVQVRICKLLPTVCLPPRKRRYREAKENDLDKRATTRYHQTKVGICDGISECAVSWCCSFHLSPYGSIPLDDLKTTIRPTN